MLVEGDAAARAEAAEDAGLHLVARPGVAAEAEDGDQRAGELGEPKQAVTAQGLAPLTSSMMCMMGRQHGIYQALPWQPVISPGGWIVQSSFIHSSRPWQP